MYLLFRYIHRIITQFVERPTMQVEVSRRSLVKRKVGSEGLLRHAQNTDFKPENSQNAPHPKLVVFELK